MEKKGFTLIEILAVIVIVALLLILVTPNILANLNTARNNVSDATKQVIFEAANLYMDENPDIYKEDVGDLYCITVETLINAGKLVSPLKDASTGGEIDKSTAVRVSISSSGRDMELVTDGTCDTGNMDILTSEDINLVINNITTKGFDVTTSFSNGYDKSNISKYDYSIDDGKNYDYKNYKETNRITNLKTGTYTVKVKVTTKDGQVIVSKSKKAVLDKIGSASFSSNPLMSVCATSKVVTVKHSTQSSASIASAKRESLKYSYTLDSSVDKSKWKSASSSYNVTVTETGTMTVRATDGVNEVTESYALTKVASPNPVITSVSVEYGSEKYYAGRITVKGRVSYCKASNSGNNVVAYCAKTSSSTPSANDSCFKNTGTSENSKNTIKNGYGSFGRDNGTYYVFIKDDKNLVSKGQKVTVNWTGNPSCSISFSGTKGNNGWYRSNITAKLTTNGNGKTVRDYKLNGSKRTSMTITAQGTTKVSCSVSAGGKTKTGSASAKKDSVKPTCTATALGNNTSNPRVRFRCSDSTSGCVSSGTTKYGGGTHSYTCKDKAGNTKKVSKYVKKYVPPVVSSSGGSSGGQGCWSMGGASINCSTMNTGSCNPSTDNNNNNSHYRSGEVCVYSTSPPSNSCHTVTRYSCCSITLGEAYAGYICNDYSSKQAWMTCSSYTSTSC
jgi:prepilin-type N-terminal cleavage/methylation domain-containing protein